jgi:signal transduction histidine kinase
LRDFIPVYSPHECDIVELEIVVFLMDSSLPHRSLTQTATRSSPLRLLLILEWVLLGVAALIQMLVATTHPQLDLAVLNILGLAIFGAMRTVFPRRWNYKLLYTAGEFGLLLLLTFWGNFPSPALLYIVLTIRNCELFAGADTLHISVRSSVTFLALASCLVSQTARLWSGRMLFTVAPAQIVPVGMGLVILYMLEFLFLHLFVDTLLAARQGQEQLAEANMRLRSYALRVEELATVQERNRIARDIHDSLGHSLTVFNIHTEAALRLLYTDPPEAEALLLELKQLGSQALDEVRQSVTLLRADPLQGRSLQQAIEHLVKEFERTTGILPTFTYEIFAQLAVELDFTLYRLVQESLTNIRKHACASAVEIAIHQTDLAIQANIQDNGRGFDLQHNPSGFGLQGMQERTLALGGRLEIFTAPDCGCKIQVVFPAKSR